MTVTDDLDRRIAEIVYNREYDPRWDRYTSDPEVAQELVDRMGEGGITVQVEGNDVSLYRGKDRLVTCAGQTRLVALCRAVVRLVEQNASCL